MSTALTQANREAAIREVHAEYSRILTGARKADEAGKPFGGPLHVAKLQVILRGIEDLAAKLGVEL